MVAVPNRDAPGAISERLLVASAQPCAVVFTHMGGLNQADLTAVAIGTKYDSFFRNYFNINDHGPLVKTVYCYIDWAVRQYLYEFTTNGTININPNLLAGDELLIGGLRRVERRVRGERRTGSSWPQFVYVGFQKLSYLLNTLIDVDKDLPQYLFGATGGTFTYDAPKFVEAVLRLVRMGRPHLALDPIVRVDEDVAPTTSFFTELLKGYRRIEQENDFYFFSGTYGSDAADPINDFAARAHFFLDVPWTPGSSIPPRTLHRIKMFFSDLSVLGAPQYPSGELRFSSGAESIMAKGNRIARESAQCISGAGLIMSRNAVELLPPFTNFDLNNVWVDDHVKRRLHETLRHLDHDAPEVVEGARAAQNRHPGGIVAGDLSWATDYFDRLLRGCCLMSIVDPPNDISHYCSLVSDIVAFKVRAGDSRLLPSALQPMVSWMEETIKGRYVEAVECWAGDEYRGTLLHDWACTRDAAHRDNTLQQVISDARKYLDLTLNWPAITRAILRLRAQGNDWLYEEPT